MTQPPAWTAPACPDLQTQPCRRHRGRTRSHQDDVGLKCLLLAVLGGLHVKLHGVALHLGLVALEAQLPLEPLLGQRALEGLGDLPVLQWHRGSVVSMQSQLPPSACLVGVRWEALAMCRFRNHARYSRPCSA